MRVTLLAFLAIFAACSTSFAQPATFQFAVPNGAKLYVDDKEVKSRNGDLRASFLVAKTLYFYDVKVVVQDKGREFVSKERVFFRAGDRISKSYFNVLNEAQGRAYPKRFQIPHDLRMFDDLVRTQIRQRVDETSAKVEPIDSRGAERTTILSAIADSGSLEIDPNSIAEVSYDRLAEGTLKVVVQLHHGTATRRFGPGRIADREMTRIYCTYTNVGGDWTLDSYWTLRGDTIGDLLIRWENTLRRNYVGPHRRFERNDAVARFDS